MKNYSRQREAIREYLCSTKEHPTAQAVYRAVRGIIPDISLGTVYRNLAELKKQGDIIEISVSDGSEHYDADISPHLHLACRECGVIADLPFDGSALLESALEEGFEPQAVICVVQGLCKECKNKIDFGG